MAAGPGPPARRGCGAGGARVRSLGAALRARGGPAARGSPGVSCPSFLIAEFALVPGRPGVPDGNGRTWSNRTTRYARSHFPSRPSWEGTGVLHRASGREARPQSAPPAPVPRWRPGTLRHGTTTPHPPCGSGPRGRLRSDHVASPRPVQRLRSARPRRPERLRRGVRWDGAGPRQRYVTRVYARLGRLGTPAVASHVSAAAVHGLPALSGWNARCTPPCRSRCTAAGHRPWSCTRVRCRRPNGSRRTGSR